MQRGFPLELLRLVRCSVDGGELQPVDPQGTRFVEDGIVGCGRCGTSHRIEDGVLSLLGAQRLHPESAREMQQRDAKNAAILSGARQEWASRNTDAIETRPTLDATAVGPGMTVLELGCGAGRYTLDLLERAGTVVALDFSRPGLLVLRRKLAADSLAGLVQADVTQPYAAARAFDRALSTLHSNLPDGEQRMASLLQVAYALKEDGRAVISMHHFSGRDRLTGVPAAGRYPDSGIFRYHMRSSEARRETAPFFGRVGLVHISAGIPGLRSSTLARAAARVPLVRSALSRLFLAVAERPLQQEAGGSAPTTVSSNETVTARTFEGYRGAGA
jgi:SAM-dependent methyltransferase